MLGIRYIKAGPVEVEKKRCCCVKKLVVPSLVPNESVVHQPVGINETVPQFLLKMRSTCDFRRATVIAEANHWKSAEQACWQGIAIISDKNIKHLDSYKVTRVLLGLLLYMSYMAACMELIAEDPQKSREIRSAVQILGKELYNTCYTLNRQRCARFVYHVLPVMLKNEAWPSRLLHLINLEVGRLARAPDLAIDSSDMVSMPEYPELGCVVFEGAMSFATLHDTMTVALTNFSRQ